MKRSVLSTVVGLALVLSACGGGDSSVLESSDDVAATTEGVSLASGEDAGAGDAEADAGDTESTNAGSNDDSAALVAALAATFEADGIEAAKAECTAQAFVDTVGVDELAAQGVTVESPEIPIDPDSEDVNPLFIEQVKAGVGC